MNKLIKTSLRIFLGTLVALQFLLGTATVVHAEDPSPDINMIFYERVTYVCDSDEFVDHEVTAGKSWETSLISLNETSIEGAHLVFGTAVNFTSITPDPTNSLPPVYSWDVGTLDANDLWDWYLVADPSPAITENFTPGYNISRSFDKTVFNSGNTSVQVMTVTITPSMTYDYESLWVGTTVPADNDRISNAQIVGNSANGTCYYYIAPDKKVSTTMIEGLCSGTAVTITIEMEFDTLVDGLEFKPYLSIHPRDGENLGTGNVTGSQLAYNFPEAGTWVWMVGDEYDWTWAATKNRLVEVPGICEIPPLYEDIMATFRADYTHSVYASDIFIDHEVTVDKSWAIGIINDYEPGGQDIDYVSLTLDADTDFNFMMPDSTSSSPPLYYWDLGTVTNGMSTWNHFSGASPPITANFTPGFNISRSFDQTIFDFGSNTTQVINVLMTPVSPDVDEVSFSVSTHNTAQVNSTILSANISPESSIIIAPDGRSLHTTVTGLSQNSTVNMTVMVLVNSFTDGLEYKPAVFSWLPEEEITTGTTTGNTVSYTDPEAGTWMYSANGTYDWEWKQNIRKGVVFLGTSTSSPYEALTFFYTNCSHMVYDSDYFIDHEVTVDKSWSTGLTNTSDPSGLPIEGVNLALSTNTSFSYIYPTPTISSPPFYYWDIGTVNEGTSIGGYSCSGAYPSVSTNFTPGFNVYRNFNQTTFTAGNVTTQIMNVVVIPTSIENDELSIGVSTGDNGLANATILSAEIYPETSFYLAPDGQNLSARIVGLTPGSTVNMSVTLQLNPTVDELEYKPFVSVSLPQDTISSGMIQNSNSVSYTEPEIGNWMWSTNGTYDWGWFAVLNRNVMLAGICQDTSSPQNGVNVQFITVEDYGSPSDEFINDSVNGTQSYQTVLLNMNDPIPGLSLMIQTGSTFEQMNPIPQVYGPPVYFWGFPEETQGNSSFVFFRKPEGASYLFTPGYDVSREFDKIVFTQSETDVQTMTVTVIPRKPEMTSCTVNMFALVSSANESVNATFISPAIDPQNGISGSPDGNYRGITLTGLELNVPRSVTVQLQVTAITGDIQYKPFVVVNEITDIDSGSITGNGISRPNAEFGSWTWNGTGTYTWNWVEQKYNEVHFLSTYQTVQNDEVTVRLLSSNFTGLEGGTIQYYDGGWQPFGTTNGNGEATLELDPGAYTFRMTYDGASVDITQDIEINPVVIFQMTNVVVQFKDSYGSLLDTGTVQYYVGGWKEFGTTNNGTVYKELLPKEYTFRMVYGGGSNDLAQDISIDPVVKFQTTNVTVMLTDSYGYPLDTGIVQYYASGWNQFGTTMNGTVVKELLPKEYTFRITYDGASNDIAQDVGISPVVAFQTMNVMVQLIDSVGNPLTGAVQYYASGWKELGTTASGNATKQLLPKEYTFRVNYDGASNDLAQDVSVNPVVTFQTTSVSVSLQDSYGNLLDTGTVQYYAEGWNEFGVTNNGTVTKELLPKQYTFRIGYSGSSVDLAQDISIDPAVSFQTGRIVSTSGNCTSYYAGGWQPFTSGDELLPGTYTFRFSDGTPDTVYDITKGTVNTIH